MTSGVPGPDGGVAPDAVRPGVGGPVLVAFAGLPGVGKTTLAVRVGAALHAPVLPVEPVERALQRYGLVGDVPELAVYGAVAGLAEVQLGLGLSVVVDAVNPVASARGIWHDLAERSGVPLRMIEVHCGDEAEHRRRVEARLPDEQLPSWEQTLVRRAEYEPIIGPRLVVDTAVDTDPLPGILAYLR
ncbi:ATP-binding protein [Micromonospora sp. DR5-3]|uniref:AAA family ATPase n=1 Tax=unclassified Micromonospora TaxID=2617518 RepID=UPI0011D59D2C|nr:MULTISPECIES: ATP-binding protein [unclassified Micromonospora]MCW3814272.1 ATP-binding protein [Micromonospora sp. DR5-3]TYC20502.1 ATP-binding protein [Micromonospora sp. MP36]